MTNLAQLLNDAVTVKCEKRYRSNHFAPAVVDKYQQSDTQFDWWITEVFINEVPLAEWSEAVGEYSLTIVQQPFKSKAQAKRTTVEHYAYLLEWISPSADGCDSDEYIARWDKVVSSFLTK